MSDPWGSPPAPNGHTEERSAREVGGWEGELKRAQNGGAMLQIQDREKNGHEKPQVLQAGKRMVEHALQKKIGARRNQSG